MRHAHSDGDHTRKSRRLQSAILAFYGLSFAVVATAPWSRADAPAATTGSSVAANAASICRVWDDPDGIPHGRGSDADGALACMGYLHARTRAWQMDHLRRIGQGRLAELYGKDSIRPDYVMRLLGFAEQAKKIADTLDPRTRARFEAYTRGVNHVFAALEAGDAAQAVADEFQTLHFRPDEWKVEDSILLVLLQAFDQTRRGFEVDLEEEARAAGGLPPWVASEKLPWDTTVLKKGEYTPTAAPSRAAPKTAPVKEAGSEAAETGHGSNNWVVAPSRSKSGFAWLANDPHLGLKNPPFWQWLHVDGGELSLVGASLPGVPFVASGANRELSWGLTNAYIDVADLVAVPDGDLRRKLNHTLPVIWFKSVGNLRLPFFFKRTARTQEGWPVLPIETGPKGHSLILRWSGFDVTADDFKALFDFMSSSSVAQAESSLARMQIPSWNFALADTKGGIGFRVTGRVPSRATSNAAGIPRMSLADLEKYWTYLPVSDVPHLLDPKRGYLATANNRHWPADAEHSGGRAYAQGFRATRIEEMLVATPKHDLESLRRMQCDTRVMDASYALAPLLKLLNAGGIGAGDPRVAPLAEWAKAGKLEATRDCRECILWRRLADRITEKLGVGVGAAYLKIIAALAPNKPHVDELKSLVSDVTASLDQAWSDIGIAPGGELPKWGDVHRLPFSHLSGKGLSKDLDVATPGDTTTVNVGSGAWIPETKRYRHDYGASQRMVIEMSSPPKIHQILADPANPDPWIDCKLADRIFPVDWSVVEAQLIQL